MRCESHLLKTGVKIGVLRDKLKMRRKFSAMLNDYLPF